MDIKDYANLYAMLAETVEKRPEAMAYRWFVDGGGTESVTWSQFLGEGCLESTPAVWDGGIYVGSRNGTFYALRDLE